MRVLKTIVIGLGAVLVLGFGLLIYGLTQNWHRVVGPAPRLTVGSAAGWGAVALQQPPAARLRAVTAAGDLVVLHVGEDDAARDRLIVLNPASGAVVGTFWMTQAP